MGATGKESASGKARNEGWSEKVLFLFMLFLLSCLILGELSALDRKVMHHIACTIQPFDVVESETFKALLRTSDQDGLKRKYLVSMRRVM